MGEERSALACEKKTGGSSDGCGTISGWDQSMVVPSRRGGVPVLSRASGSPSRSSVSAIPTVGGSTSSLSDSRTNRPAGRLSRPMCTVPRRKVPAVSTTARLRSCWPVAVSTPSTRPPSPRSRSSTAPSTSCNRSTSPIARCIAALYSARSAWQRGPRTAGPLERLSMRKWIPASSAQRAIRPSSASISRTRWPLPTPPMDGLHAISPTVSTRCVTRSVLAPARAAAAAASHPACPPPTTITSA